jgi:BolA protein
MSRINAMRERLATLQPIALKIIDESHKHVGHAGARDGGGHYLLQIVTNQFTGKGTLARHRMIYSALGEMMKCEIHALNIHAHTPDEV